MSAGDLRHRHALTLEPLHVADALAHALLEPADPARALGGGGGGSDRRTRHHAQRDVVVERGPRDSGQPHNVLARQHRPPFS